ncbi:MAG: PDZ domain-containing protein [Phycisphaerales bacterium]
MPDAHRLGSACVMLALLTSLSPALAQDAAPKAAPEPQPPVNTSPADPPAPGEATPPAATPAPATLDMAALDSTLAKLDDPSIEEREHAMNAIRTLPGMSVRAIGQAMQKPTLSAEQRVRLSQVGQSLFLDEPRGALGVTFNVGGIDDEEGQVQIRETTPGWDSSRALRPWDVVRSIDGLRLRTYAEARAAIISHDPGDTVSLDIVRNGQPGTVRVRLGNFADLNKSGLIDPLAYEAAWRLRASRMISEATKPLVIDLAADEWSNEPTIDGPPAVERMNHPITSEPLRTQMRQIPVSDLSAAGPSRASGERNVSDLGQMGSVRSDRPSLRVLARNQGRVEVPPEIVRRMLEAAQQQRAVLKRDIAGLRQRAADPNADARTVEILRRQVAGLEEVLAGLDQQIDDQRRDAGVR